MIDKIKEMIGIEEEFYDVFDGAEEELLFSVLHRVGCALNKIDSLVVAFEKQAETEEDQTRKESLIESVVHLEYGAFLMFEALTPAHDKMFDYFTKGGLYHWMNKWQEWRSKGRHTEFFGLPMPDENKDFDVNSKVIATRRRIIPPSLRK